MSDVLDLQTTYKAILEAARDGRFISYGDLAQANGAKWQKVRRAMNYHLGDLVEIAADRGWPMPSAIVVNKQNLETGTLDGDAREGFINAAKVFGFEVSDPATFVEEQQQAVFAWAPNAPDDLGLDPGEGQRGGDLGGPKFVQFFGPVLDALRSLGGSAEPRAAMDAVKETGPVSEEELKETNKNGQSKYENQVGWARFYLVKAGLIEGKKRGEWTLTAEGRETHLDHDSALTLFRDVHSRYKSSGGENADEAPPPPDDTPGSVFEDPDRQFWFVGAVWGGTDDQTERFLNEGIWQNG